MRHIVREPLVWKMIPGACEVEPPVSNRGPWSITSTSVTPISARWYAALTPTIPAPMITVWARSCTVVPLATSAEMFSPGVAAARVQLR